MTLVRLTFCLLSVWKISMKYFDVLCNIFIFVTMFTCLRVCLLHNVCMLLLCVVYNVFIFTMFTCLSVCCV